MKVVARTRIHNRARAGEGVSMEYLRNTWYAVAWSDEIGDQPFGRKVIEDPLVIYRTADGELHVLRDMCPHRFAPLSKGKIISDRSEENTSELKSLKRYSYAVFCLKQEEHVHRLSYTEMINEDRKITRQKYNTRRPTRK